LGEKEKGGAKEEGVSERTRRGEGTTIFKEEERRREEIWGRKWKVMKRCGR